MATDLLLDHKNSIYFKLFVLFQLMTYDVLKNQLLKIAIFKKTFTIVRIRNFKIDSDFSKKNLIKSLKILFKTS